MSSSPPKIILPLPAEAIRAPLLDWYDAHARDLPWRRTADPYAIWVSEVMLQQTRVDTVVPYWERWMERYPTVEALADAELGDVLKSWEGLGYYRRARMLHRAAVVVRDRHDGTLPGDPEALRELPGVGEYTSGAVASIAFGHAVPAVDGNVRRVLARIFDLSDPSPAQLRRRAAELVDPARPGAFNQALMELGATVCTPTSPDCPACPVGDTCRARALGVQEERPVARRRGPVPERRFAVAVACRRSAPGEPWELMLVRRPESGMLGGLWAFPEERLTGGAEPLGRALEVARRVTDGTTVAASHFLGEVRHTYSHFRGVYLAFLVEAEPNAGTEVADGDEARWADAGVAVDLPLPVVQRRILESAAGALSEGNPFPR